MPTSAYPSQGVVDEILAPSDAGSKRLPRASLRASGHVLFFA